MKKEENRDDSCRAAGTAERLVRFFSPSVSVSVCLPSLLPFHQRFRSCGSMRRSFFNQLCRQSRQSKGRSVGGSSERGDKETFVKWPLKGKARGTLCCIAEQLLLVPLLNGSTNLTFASSSSHAFDLENQITESIATRIVQCQSAGRSTSSTPTNTNKTLRSTISRLN